MSAPARPVRSTAAVKRSPPLPATSGPSPNEAGGLLTIDLTAIAANHRALAHRVLPAECAAVVKADGYGCRIEHVTAVLNANGCKTFFVANLDEARRVRIQAPQATIYVLDGFNTGTGPLFTELNAKPVINSAVELAEWDQFVAASQWRGGIALHVDTGMNRLGLSFDEAVAVAPRIHASNHGIALLMSHFITSEFPDNPVNLEQIQRFREIRTLYRGIPSSLANSSGVFLGSAAHCDMVRVGAALYGVNPTPNQPNPMQPVITLRGRVLQVRRVAKDATVGYGATWIAPRDTLVAVIAIGYADGFIRAGTATAVEPGRQVIAAGERCPIVGRVSMDLLTIDVTELSQGALHRGDLVTLIGRDGSHEISIDEAATAAGTIGYELLTSLGHRYHRTWIHTKPESKPE
jgi:alanine racemase